MSSGNGYSYFIKFEFKNGEYDKNSELFFDNEGGKTL